jgi:IstB-like ATP binding protein
MMAGIYYSLDYLSIRILNGTKETGDNAAVTAFLDRLLHHAHVLKCGPRSWRTKVQPDLRQEQASR